MDISKIGSVSSYAKGLQLKNKWKQKKASGDFASQSKKTELERKNDSFKAWYYENRNDPSNDETMEKINNKIAVGTKLSPDETEYLRQKNPALYQKLKQDEAEEKAYERDLKNAKTKDEVEDLRMEKVTKALSAISSVKSNPNIPEGTRLAVAQSEMNKLAKLERITQKFVESGEYAKLPTEDEVRQAEKEIAEAEEAALRDSGKEEEKTDKAEQESGEGADKAYDVPKRIAAEQDTDKLSDDEKTVAEAEQTPEALKWKRSKAKKAYAAARDDCVPKPQAAGSFGTGVGNIFPMQGKADANSFNKA